MPQNTDNDFMKSLLATFKAEAEEHLQAISQGLIELRQLPPSSARTELLERIYRDTHSLKGAARSVSLAAIEAICQALEDVLATVKKVDAPVSDSLSTAVQMVLDEVRRLVQGRKTVAATTSQIIAALKAAAAVTAAPLSPPDDGPALKADAAGRAAEPVETLPNAAQDAARRPDHPPALPPEPSQMERPALLAEPREQDESIGPAAPDETAEADAIGAEPLAETVRVPVARLEALLRLAEELLRVDLMSEQRGAETAALLEQHTAWTRRWKGLVAAIASSGRGLDANGAAGEPGAAPGLADRFSDTGQELSAFHSALKGFSARLDADRRWTASILDHLLASAKEVLMLQFSVMGQMLTRMAAELARAEHKQVALTVHGTHIQIDKRILDEMKDPLIHLVRNSVGHGIEPAEERRRLGKPECGTITVSLSEEDGNRVEICIEDDGAGIDCAKVRASAVKTGLLDAAESGSMDTGAVLPLIFRSGVSTSPIITSLSGRGLGLAIVNEKVEKLGGRILVDSTPGQGTRIRLVLPVTLATFRGTLVRAGERSFVIPTASVERAIRCPVDQVQSAENRETIAFAGRPISFVRLADLLGIPVRQAAENKEHVTVLVVQSAGRRIGLGVSEVIEEQEILVRSLGPQLARVRNVSGAAMLGSGALVPILNVADLMRSAIAANSAPQAADSAADAAGDVKSLLVVEDSVTSRVLLKSILQSAGYEVMTAVDGMDALTMMRTTGFDLVVSDVEMPRMNGFELTTRIRQDAAFKEVPVVLVTARESRDDKERGIECGANAYIEKSSFDQTNLLSVIEELL